MTAAGLVCGSCGIELRQSDKFCNECGAPVIQVSRSAEYKQVTVLFADVVHSMDIAAAVGAERLRRSWPSWPIAARRWCSSTAGQWTSSPATGSWRCLARPLHWRTTPFAPAWRRWVCKTRRSGLPQRSNARDGLDLRLRIGLNSGQVIAGEIGSGALGYTAIGEQVGMFQRMESVAPPGGVMLSASTARLVDGVADLGEPELVQIKGADEPVLARRLLGMREQHRGVGRAETNLVGRRGMGAVEGLLDRARQGHGAVVGVVGPPGIGKSRLVREVAAMARRRRGVIPARAASRTS